MIEHDDGVKRPYFCAGCNKRFTHRSNLAVHLRTHTGERPFQCDSCGRGFARSSDLTVHRRTHSGDRPFKCDSCDKTFARKDSRAVHMRVHTGEKPFVCKMCGKRFAHSSTLGNHEWGHNNSRGLLVDKPPPPPVYASPPLSLSTLSATPRDSPTSTSLFPVEPPAVVPGGSRASVPPMLPLLALLPRTAPGVSSNAVDSHPDLDTLDAQTGIPTQTPPPPPNESKTIESFVQLGQTNDRAAELTEF